MDHVKAAFEAFQAKQPKHARALNYYEGVFPSVLSSKQLSRVLLDYNIRLASENWCAVVVDSCTERLAVSGWRAEAETDAANYWNAVGLDEQAQAVHEAACITGESFVLVWPSEDGPIVSYVDPRSGHVEYSKERPGQALWGARLWQESDGSRAIQILEPGSVSTYRAKKEAVESHTFSASAWAIDDEMSGPLATTEVPLYHFRRSVRTVRGDIHNAMAIQDSLNATLTNMLIAADFSSIPQRYAITASELGRVGFKPGGIITFPPGDGETQNVEVGEFQPAPMDGFLETINHHIAAIAAVTRTPRHYFLGQTGTPSGEALKAMEAPLVKRVHDCQTKFGRTWARVMAAVMRADGKQVEPGELAPVWESAETEQPYMRAQVRQMATQAGMPLSTVLRREGWTEEELDQMDDDRIAEGEAKLLAQVNPAEVTAVNAQEALDAITAAATASITGPQQ